MVAGRVTRLLMLAVLVALTVAVAPALGAFPGSDPDESPRLNTPNDPEFDNCESDDETAGVEGCNSYFNEQFNLFGFSPDSAFTDPVTKSRTQYTDCSQLDAQGRAANVAAGDPECSQIAGIRADTAWKYSTGDPGTAVAILDTGIEWEDARLIDKVRLHRAELPEPRKDGPRLREGVDCTKYNGAGFDANGDGAFNVADYACDSRLTKTAGDNGSKGQAGADALLDASDLIATFSDKTDAGANGYVDDIAGWDFFDDDNDPFDASSCCSADGHGTDRAAEAGMATNDGAGETGVCPQCQVMPLRVWDTFVVDTNLFALATVYAADNGASVVEGAVGGLLNSNFARRAFTYADSKGVALTLVSSDINSANHNYPTNYNEAIYVGGSLPDSVPSGEDCDVPSLPLAGGGASSKECAAFFAELRDGTGGALLPTLTFPTTSFFRNSNLTQYGGKADVVLVGSTGSANTGQASGAAGLLASYGRKTLAGPLSGNEIRQLLTMTAEDVLPANTGSIGLPDKASKGWDPHFGYGRVSLAGAMARIKAKRIPPEAQLNAPDWFAPINVDRVGAEGVPVKGRVAGPHVDGAVEWRLEYVCGQDTPDAEFTELRGWTEGEPNGLLGNIPKSVLQGLADNCDGSVANDAGRPAGRPTEGPFPVDPYPEPDPERHAFQIRLTAREKADPGNIAVYRKTLHAYRDDGNLSGWPRPVGSGSVPADYVTGSGGESSPRFADLDADNQLDILLPTTSGELFALKGDGTPLLSFNGGKPVSTDLYSQAQSHPGAGGLGEGLLAEPPREPLRVPAVGDVTGDGEPEVMVTAGERMYAWTRRGQRLKGFPKRVNPALSAACKPGLASCFDFAQRNLTRDKHLKRGFFSSPSLADLDGDGKLDIVAGALDQHVYAWRGTGALLPGFPKRLDSGDASDGAEIVTSPAIAELDGDKTPEIVIATNEVVEGSFPEGFPNLQDIGSIFVGQATGSNVVYAINGDGSPVKGWPVELGVLAGDILPLVVPSHDAAVVDLDGDGRDEVSLSAATAAAKLVDSDGTTIKTYQNLPGPASSVADQTLQLNLADYPAIGRLSDSDPPSVFKGGLSLNGAANLLAVNQNLPFNHALQAWSLGNESADPRNGAYLPGFPVATDDFQLLSQPVVAKVDGSGGGRQAITGTGLYQLHAYGALGREPAGWPKFLGGWVQSTPTVGDVNGDGKLDVMAFTREGWSFVWSTGAPECSVGQTTTNDEWWTFHHDEHGTANYGADARAPSRPGALSVRRLEGGDLRIAFPGSGDDLRCGEAVRYEVAGSKRPIQSGAAFVEATRLATARDGARAKRSTKATAAAHRVTVDAKGGRRFAHVAVRAVDDAGNVSYIRGTPVQTAAGDRDPERKGNRDDDDSFGRPDDDEDDGSAAAAVRDTDSGSLPFTGLVLASILVAGLMLLAAGLAVRRRVRGRAG
ncbi:MAG: FG-GAP-like repeat-containing protein [Thermoleophilaceae bacterium]